MKADNVSVPKITVVVRHGIVKSIFINKRFDTAEVEIPKKAALEAILMFELLYGGGIATVHDVFIAMQEIIFTLKSENVPESKLLAVEENMARALTLRWSDFDLAKAVEY